MGVGKRQIHFHSEGGGHGAVWGRVEETGNAKSQIPRHTQTDPKIYTDTQKDTTTRCVALANTQVPTHSLIHEYGLSHG